MRRRTPSVARFVSATRLFVLTGALLALAACGGGGGGDDGPSGPIIIDGLAGTVLLPDYDLGRIVEQEPNDLRSQPFRLPPIWPRCTVELTGHLGTSLEWFGHVDATDVFVWQCVESQRVSLELTFQSLDPTAVAAANDFGAEVFRKATGVSVATTAAGGQPRTLTFDAAAGEDYEVVLAVAGMGHGWWVVRFVCEDLLLAPKPTPGPAALSVPVPTQAPVPAGGETIQPGQQCAHTHVLVRLRAGCGVDGVCGRHGLRAGAVTGQGSHRVLFDTHADADPEARAGSVCATLREDPDVLWAEPDWVVHSLGEPGDPEFSRQWNMRAVGAVSAWDVTTGSASVVIGVVDTGIGASPDLEGRTVAGYDFISSAAIAGDGNGRDDDPTDEGDQFAGDGTSVWHGTHVAGILAANHDDYGVAGMAPGCKLMMLRALGIGGGFVSDAADAILFLAGQLTLSNGRRLAAPLRIANLSIGLAQDSAELREACQRADNLGVLLVAAVGNRGGRVEYPAAYPSTFAVAAVNGQLLTTQYSAFGSQVDIAAPGGGAGTDTANDGWHDGVLSAVKDETVEPAAWSHAYLVGTSQAAPHVAGAAALLLSIDPTLKALDLRNILRGTALDLGVPGDDIAYGSGLLQVHEAVKVALNRTGNPRGDAPYLILPMTSLQFDGLRTSIDVPLMNGGGGTLSLFFATALADDGGAWLDARLEPVLTPSPPVNNSRVTITVDRSRLPAGPGRYSGTVRFANSLQSHGTIRVVVYVQQRTRAGELLPVVALEDETGIARRKAFAIPETGYRYWLRNLPASDFRLTSGEDLDLDGLFCEGADACGWYGGALQGDALLVPYIPGVPAIRGLGITLSPPP